MEITINLDTLTPAQAFQIGFQLRERPEYHKAPVEVIEPKTQSKARNLRARRTTVSNRYKNRTSCSMEIVQLCVYLRKSGLTLQQIADTLNERNIPSPSGKPWSDAMAWPVVYSQQSWPLWKDA
jgi:hypothetical protein